MEKKILSIEQLRKMLGLLEKVNVICDRFLSRSDITLEEAVMAREIMQAAESYARVLNTLPDSDAEFWAPVVKAVITEMLKKILGDVPDDILNMIMNNVDTFINFF